MVILLKNLFFTIVVPGTVAVYVPLIIRGDQSPASGFLLTSAVIVLATGTGVYAWCVWDFATFGRGTPAPIDMPKRLVVRGLYQYSRNPMYLGVLSVVLGWTILFQLPALLLYLVLIWIGFHCFVVLYEEPQLRRAFGDDYDAYCRRVGRWLPKSPRSSPSL